jgi:beta-glucanase (GH16 family)
MAVAALLLPGLAIPSTAAAGGLGPAAGPVKAVASGVPSVSAQTATPTCGNEQLAPRAGGGNWTCTFDDEFDASTGDATSLNTSLWTPLTTAGSGYTSGPGGALPCYLNSPNNVSVSNGALHLTVRQESGPFNCAGLFDTSFTSGMVTTVSKFSQTYGHFEVRALLPSTVLPGLQETLWLYPQNLSYGPWPNSGEVDFSEFYSLYSIFDVPYIHYNDNPLTTNGLTNTNVTNTLCLINFGQYNTYGMTWQPGTFTIYVDGNPCLTDNYQATGLPGGASAAAPFDQPFFVALTQALGTGLNTYQPLLTPLPATTSIDYVRVWR